VEVSAVKGHAVEKVSLTAIPDWVVKDQRKNYTLLASEVSVLL